VRKEKRYTSLDEGWEAVPADKFDQTGHSIDNISAWEQATPKALLANKQFQTVIEKAFQILPVIQRAAMTMVDMEGFEIEKVCNILDVSSSNARELQHRAHVAVHQSIEQYQDN